MMTKAEIRRIIKTLNNASVCCHECGDKWGVYSVGCSSTWNGTCRVCGEEKPVTETRDYAYFCTGIRKLKEQLKEASK
jgi:hypothetical protein